MDIMELEKVLIIMKFSNNQVKYILNYVNIPIQIQELYLKINFLKELNLNNRIIRLVIEENPKLLTTDLIKIKKLVNYIKTKVSSNEIPNIIECTPQILTIPIEQLINNENLLTKYFSEERIKVIYRYRPSILKLDNEYLNYKTNLIVKNGFEKNIFKIIMMHPEFFLKRNCDIEYLKKMF